jgi:hypothetical protein
MSSMHSTGAALLTHHKIEKKKLVNYLDSVIPSEFAYEYFFCHSAFFYDKKSSVELISHNKSVAVFFCLGK